MLNINPSLGYDPRARIIKAELLWTKKCPFSCSFCGMVQNERAANEKSDEETFTRWKKGMDNLKLLGCEFTAIYGAEPLTRMKYLPELIKYQRDIGMEQTVITALYKPERIRKLIDDGGLNSLTVSYDLKVTDDDRMEKSDNGTRLLNDFPEVEDRACVITLMKDNQDLFLTGAKDVLDSGYWLLFDIVHPGYEGVDPKTGYNLSKCVGSVDEYRPDVEKVQEIINQLIEWKKEGKRIHASIDLLENMRDRYTAANGVVRDSYHCGKHASLGWVTIGSELQVYACDDWQMEYHKPLDEMTTLEDWVEFFEWRREESLKTCPGCMWNTHYNTHEIIESGKSGSYVHNNQDLDIKGH